MENLKKGNAKIRFNYCKLNENLYINNPIGDERLLNKKSEFVSKCRKQNKFLIKSVLLKDSMD